MCNLISEISTLTFLIMKNKSFIILIFSLLTSFSVLLSCKSDPDKPENILSKDEMVQTLADIYVVEEKVRRLNLNSDSTQLVFEKLKGKIFASKKMEDSVFRKSFDYYMDRPKELELIYTALVDSLNLREQRESLKTKEEE